MENSKLIATVASIWIQCTCGPSYAFGIYSAALKSSQGYDQSTLDTVSVFKDIGTSIGVLAGLLYRAVADNKSASSSRFGSGLSLVYLAGAIQFFAGYFLMWLSVTGVIEKPPVYLMCFFMFMAAHAQTFFDTANIVVAVQNFPAYSGTSVGIMKVAEAHCEFFRWVDQPVNHHYKDLLRTLKQRNEDMVNTYELARLQKKLDKQRDLRMMEKDEAGNRIRELQVEVQTLRNRIMTLIVVLFVALGLLAVFICMS